MSMVLENNIEVSWNKYNFQYQLAGIKPPTYEAYRAGYLDALQNSGAVANEPPTAAATPCYTREQVATIMHQGGDCPCCGSHSQG
jgi:hypothetical protein